ncbi:menaquinone-dependent protoporphyrinogen oxidase [Methanomicrobium sp. W14]|uniref:flavodoxin domain-containing protein n=1 Tax=Methanomicrobium sp. W14 TaxID=2817839 RepID=UPI001AE42CDD|nr:flavodoxin domain-containing protein [Methanomicrobium sp. W14]MBP2132924.1 menaquinone-dependent protoporphyrinogen oxidase [Methanomicrobium sp. W14]
MSTNFKNVLDFIIQNENEIFSSPRALFGTGEEELFTILKINGETNEINLKTEDNRNIAIKCELLKEAVRLLEDKHMVPISVAKYHTLSMEEHLSLWQSGTDNTTLNKKTVPYITDIIVLSGFAAYGWAKSGNDEKFAAVAVKEKQQKKNAPKDTNIVKKENKEALGKNVNTVKSEKNVQKKTDLNDKKVLITYSTKYGSTADIAWSIKNSFQDDGITADVKHIQDVDDVREYSFVIIGSPIYDGKMLPEVIEFVELHKNWLSKRMTALFISGMSLNDKTDEAVLEAKKIADDIEKRIELIDTGMFPGKLSPENLPVKKRINAIFNKRKTGDFRDWRDIGEWADKIKKIYLNKIKQD